MRKRMFPVVLATIFCITIAVAVVVEKANEAETYKVFCNEGMLVIETNRGETRRFSVNAVPAADYGVEVGKTRITLSSELTPTAERLVETYKENWGISSFSEFGKENYSKIRISFQDPTKVTSVDLQGLLFIQIPGTQIWPEGVTLDSSVCLFLFNEDVVSYDIQFTLPCTKEEAEDIAEEIHTLASEGYTGYCGACMKNKECNDNSCKIFELHGEVTVSIDKVEKARRLLKNGVVKLMRPNYESEVVDHTASDIAGDAICRDRDLPGENEPSEIFILE